MSHTYHNLVYHVEFATKGRERWLDDDLRPWLFAQIAALIDEKNGVCLIAGGVIYNFWRPSVEARVRPLGVLEANRLCKPG